MEISGVVIHIGEIETGQGKKEPWQKQLIVIETPGQYKNKVAVYYWGAMTDTITQIGQEITAHVNVNSREYSGKWYTELRVWKTVKTGFTELPESRLSKEAKSYDDDTSSSTIYVGGSGDLPF
jgi:Domain of unknown function (DUF3127)